MSDHEFEKQVRQKLDDLRLTPSASAWENIENKIREDKRRRAPFIWLPLLLLGLAAGAYFIFNPTGSSSPLAKKEISNTDVQTKKEAQVNASDVNSNDRGINEARQNDQRSNEKITRPTVAPENIQDASRNNSDRITQNIRQTSRRKVNTEEAEHISQKANESFNHQEAENTDLSSDQDAALNEDQIKEEIARLNKIASPQNKPKLKANDSLMTATASAVPAPKPKKKTNKWSFGISGFAGISAVNLNKAMVEDVSNSPTALIAPSYTPSEIKPGFSYSIGGVAKRELSKRFSLSAGVNYLQLNTVNKVGNKVYGSQVVNGGNRGYSFVYTYFTLQQDKPEDYKNRYHFIEVPVTLNTRLGKSEKLPLYLNTGISVSRLLNSNSLHFDGTTGIYYKNDRLLNLTQASVTTGVSFILFNKTSKPLWIGPSARYNLTKVLQKDVSANKNFMSLGIDMKLFIR